MTRQHLPPPVYECIQRAHNHVIGHNGVEATLRKLRTQGPMWPGARQDVRTFITQCPFCQKNTERLIPTQTNPYSVSEHRLFECLAIDTIGPLPLDRHGNQHIIVIIDAFSRLIELYPSPSTEAIPAANALLNWVCRYGVPSRLRSDNGTQFVNELIRAFCTLYDINHHTIAAYSHEQNGMVERANKQVLTYLRAIVFDRNVIEDWSAMLPMAQKIMNSQVHSVLNVSPIDLVFGQSINLELLPVPYLDSANHIATLNRVDYKDWLAQKLEKQTQLLAIAYQHQKEDDIYKLSQPPTEITEFPINSYVLQRYENDDHRPPHKLNTRLKGPHRVLSKRNDGEVDIYTVENLATNKLEDFKVHDLQPFNHDPAYHDPKAVAMHDQQLYAVEAIRDHKGNRNQRSRLTFLVKWLGYPDSANTWEPWANLRNNRVLHTYLREHGMASLIPKQWTQAPDLQSTVPTDTSHARP